MHHTILEKLFTYVNCDYTYGNVSFNIESKNKSSCSFILRITDSNQEENKPRTVGDNQEGNILAYFLFL